MEIRIAEERVRLEYEKWLKECYNPYWQELSPMVEEPPALTANDIIKQVLENLRGMNVPFAPPKLAKPKPKPQRFPSTLTSPYPNPMTGWDWMRD